MQLSINGKQVVIAYEKKRTGDHSLFWLFCAGCFFLLILKTLNIWLFSMGVPAKNYLV